MPQDVVDGNGARVSCSACVCVLRVGRVEDADGGGEGGSLEDVCEEMKQKINGRIQAPGGAKAWQG